VQCRCEDQARKWADIKSIEVLSQSSPSTFSSQIGSNEGWALALGDLGLHLFSFESKRREKILTFLKELQCFSKSHNPV